MRCQCSKPDFVFTERSFWATWWTDLKEPFIHFKKADRFCERCGVGLCLECSYDYKIDIIDSVFTTFDAICHTCEELEL